MTNPSTRRLAPLALALLAGLAACGSGTVTGSTDTPADGSAAASTTDRTSGEVRVNGGQVTFAFGGDVHFERELRTLLDDDPTSPLSTQREVLSGADLAMVNLETAITDRGTAAAKQYTFRAPAVAFTALAAAGVDVVTIANNHGLDFGAVGRADTLAAADAAGFPIVGIGNDAAQAYRPWRVEVNGQRIAVIGATQVLDDSSAAAWAATDTQGGVASAKLVPRLVEEVKRARADSDTVVVYLHWGTERISCPNPQQFELAAALQQAGADIIVGGHAHVLLGGGMLDNAFVDYGLGNYFFYATTGDRADTGVVIVKATGRHIDGYEFKPAHISGGQARSLTGAAAVTAVKSWSALRACTHLTPGPEAS